ncbi:uncharacterized protein PHACADRAFT_207573 [Phanerochaete carnosa HHB-10118-sp]|uniref:DUF6533 domain-containing protein n=1 Tax=Phanerochaete carnosa (strain HHB-10118-sp) TaxID=650164 RepID=K5X0M9_PHACS|nr:uncharacterized protein PHACADRAFT_207573 [Phanerochaete carnosa HHB-10118-sp]EKM56292.1 hypothetical protein PHACADRAFT_207573 [Phanerochaete carnosa HHB-10118-sp]
MQASHTTGDMAQSNEDTQQELSSALTSDYVAYSVLCLVIYEYGVTLDQEISAVWRRKFTVTSVLLLTTRWLMILGPILNATASEQAQFPVGTNVFLWARTVLGYVDTPLIVGCTVVVNILPKLNTESESVLLRLLFLIAVYMPLVLYFTRCSLIAADVIVLLLTWIKSFRHFKEMRQLKLGLSISAVLLRDDKYPVLSVSCYALLAISILELLTFSQTSVTGGNYADAFIQYMPLLLVQRFILNLRQLNRTTYESNSDAQHFSRFSASFRVPSDFLGNIGEPLGHGQSERDKNNGDDDSCVAEESREGHEEDFAHLAGPTSAYRDETIEADAALALRSAECASEGDVIGSLVFSGQMGVGSSTAI